MLHKQNKIKVPTWLIISIIVYIIIFFILLYIRQNTFQHNGSEGIMEDILLNSINGKFFYSNTFNQNFLGLHFSLIYILFFPMYYILKSYLLFFLIKSFFISSGSIIIYKLSNKLELSEIKHLLTIIFLISPIMWLLNFDDFFIIIVTIPLILMTIYFLKEKKMSIFYLLLIILLVVEEETTLIIMMLGIYLFLKHEKKIGLKVFFIGIIGFILITNIIIPSFSNEEFFIYSDRFEYLGDNPVEIAKTIIQKPLVILNIFLTKVDYIYTLLLGFLFLPLISSFSIIAIPIFLINILSTNTELLCLPFHYTSLIVVVFFISTLFGLKYLKQKFGSKIIKKITYLLLVLNIIICFTTIFLLINKEANLNQIPVINNYCYQKNLPSFNYEYLKEQNKNYHDLHKSISNMPLNTSVLGSHKLLPILKQLEFDFLFPNAEFFTAEHIIIDKEENDLFYDSYPLTELYEKIYNQNYELVLKNKNYLIFS